tara:strand:+ start:53 stop:328 length:276 start_codon:yes stop_codon:yes gene_type:complete
MPNTTKNKPTPTKALGYKDISPDDLTFFAIFFLTLAEAFRLCLFVGIDTFSGFITPPLSGKNMLAKIWVKEKAANGKFALLTPFYVLLINL